MCLETECNRRKDQGLAPLSKDEQVAFTQDFLELFKNEGPNITLDQATKASATLRLLARDREADKEQRHHLAALFTAHYTRVRLELDDVEEYMQSHKRLGAQELE
jgi:hypothetical protein|tara:strand:- start:22872 stop:23186 length:315 start_codon:yes stop_codon:yes gene_type:complete